MDSHGRRAITSACEIVQIEFKVVGPFENSQSPATILPVIPSEVEESAFIYLPRVRKADPSLPLGMTGEVYVKNGLAIEFKPAAITNCRFLRGLLGPSCTTVVRAIDELA
jgi:hypothetical protein